MKHLLPAILVATCLFAACTENKPHLGRVVDGYLVNVDAQGIGLQGYDPVSFRMTGARKGRPDLQSTYHGAIYLFETPENKAAFDANPTAFEPDYGGYCAYGLAVGNLAPIELWTFDTTYQNRNIFNHNQKAVNGWKKDVPGNDAKAKVQWARFQEQFVANR